MMAGELTFGKPLMKFNRTIIPIVRVSKIVRRGGAAVFSTPVALFILENNKLLFAPLQDGIAAEDIIKEINSLLG
jgi:hypothetical protein